MPEDEDEAEDNMSRPRSRPRTKFRPRAQSGLEDLTSLNHKHIITKELLDNIGGWPEGYVPINAGHPMVMDSVCCVTDLNANQQREQERQQPRNDLHL